MRGVRCGCGVILSWMVLFGDVEIMGKKDCLDLLWFNLDWNEVCVVFFWGLFLFDGVGGFGCVVVDYVVDVFDFVDDLGGDVVEECGVEWIDVGGYVVG